VDLPKHLTKQGNFGAPIEHGLHNFKPFGELMGATILLNPDTYLLGPNNSPYIFTKFKGPLLES
jgi:hypothetical protein